MLDKQKIKSNLEAERDTLIAQLKDMGTLNTETNEWSEPENIGYPINTPDDDVYFSTSKDGKRWYYSSVREDGLGYTDIYLITPGEVPQPL